MTEAARLSVVVEAKIGQLERGLSQAQAQLVATKRAADRLDGSTAAMGKSSRKTGGAMAAMGGQAKMLAGAAGIGGLGLAMTKVVKTTAGFEKQMASTRSVSGATARQMVQLRQQAKSMGTALGIGATEAAQAQTELAKGGLSTAAILSGGFKSAMTLAAAGEVSMADAAMYTVNAMKQFGIQGKNAQSVADAFAISANQTTADVSDFGIALTQGGGAAKMAGLSFRQTMVMLQALADNSVKGSDAGTSMKNAMLSLLAPTDQATAAMKKRNIALKDSNGQMKSASEISSILRERTKGMNADQRAALFTTIAGRDGFRQLLALYDAGPEKLKKMSAAFAQQGYAAEVAREKQRGLHGDLARMAAEWESAQIEFGEALGPGLSKGVQAVTKAMAELRESGDLKGLGQELGAVVGDMGSAAPAAAAGVRELSQAMSRLSESREQVRGITEGFTSSEDAARKMFAVMDQGLPAMKALGLGPGKLVGDITGLGDKIKGLNKVSVKVPVLLSGEDQVIQGMKNIDALKLKEKIARILGKDISAKAKVKEIEALDLPEKWAKILGRNSDAIAKINAVIGLLNSVQDKTVTLTTINRVQNITENIRKDISSGGRGNPGRPSLRAAGGRIDRPELAWIGEGQGREWVIPDDPRYRRDAVGWLMEASASMGVAGFAKGTRKGKKPKRKKNRLEQTDPTQRPANTGSSRPFAGMQPPQSLFDQTAAPEAPQFSAAEVALAQARAMGDLGSIQAASQRILGDKTAAYQAAVASGDSDKIKEAADALKSAGDELRDAGAAIVQANLDRWDASLVAAKIATPKDVTDDIAALSGALGVASAAYNDAVGRGDIQQQIQFGNEVINLTSSIEDLKKSVDDSAERQKQQNELLKQQLDEARRLAAASGAAKDAIIKGLVDAANRQLGGVLGQSLTTPSTTGRVAALR